MHIFLNIDEVKVRLSNNILYLISGPLYLLKQVCYFLLHTLKY